MKTELKVRASSRSKPADLEEPATAARGRNSRGPAGQGAARPHTGTAHPRNGTAHPRTSAEFLDAIRSRTAVVGVVGLGYVGLPLVRTFCAAGFHCLGFDVDASKVRALNAGKSYIKHIPSSMISGLVKKEQFHATDDPAALRDADAILICVPTPLSKSRDPDMSYVEGTAHVVAEHLRRGHLVVLESTTYPGTTRELVQPILESSGLKVEKDFFLAYSPEREDPGRTDYSTETIPKVVGGIGPHSRKIANALYGAAIRMTVPVSSCEVAESCKILENVYRSVNIAMVNELKLLFDRMGIDVWEVIAAASTKPFGFQPFYPGPGLGGHCIPIDPFYLTWKARQHDMPTRFIELAGEINKAMPEYVVHRVAEGLNTAKKAINGSKVLLLGLAYKKNVDDLRESPSIELIELLRQRGARVDYNDPYIPRTHKQREHDLKLKSVKLTESALASYDCVLIATDHSDYDYAWIVEHARLVVDTRNATAGVKKGRTKIVKA
ncbi:MAG: nucleotide sugar dehydrogenase [Phycisphaerales bacterium]|nr:MAG: nucleotide sugar dehydrogenase [Phycisphaerales bacterium]